MKINEGEIIQLDNNKEYICFSTISDQNDYYVYLISNFKPLEVKFAKEISNGDSVSLEIINDQNQKKKLLKLFTDKQNNKTSFWKEV